MRLLVAAFLLLALAPPAASQAEGTHATLDIDVQEDRSERMRLAFEGLRPLTQYNGICLPKDARETRVHDDVGDVAYDVREEDGRRTISFVARSERLFVDMTRRAPSAADDPLFSADVNFCVPQESGVTVNVRVPPDHSLFFLSDGGAIANGRSGSASSDGPTHLFYSYEAPVAGRRALEVFDEGPFRVYAAPPVAQQAREVARLAAAPYRAALEEAGLDAPFDRMRLLYARETPFDWEAGHYNGRGYVQVKESTLDPDPTTGYPYSSVKVVVHEAFHAASFPQGQGRVAQTVSWWLEGTARLAERQVDLVMPNASTYCESGFAEVKCWSFDDRIDRQNLSIGYAPDFAFRADWEPSLPQPDDTRRFYYAYSEFVVAAWVAQHGEARYREVWDRVAAAFERGEGCPCGEGWLEGLLDDPDLFRPWQDVRERDPEGFEARVAPLVKDEAALTRAIDDQLPLGGLDIAQPWWVALAALAAGLALAARRAG